jgi:hypothetical protein
MDPATKAAKNVRTVALMYLNGQTSGSRDVIDSIANTDVDLDDHEQSTAIAQQHGRLLLQRSGS